LQRERAEMTKEWDERTRDSRNDKEARTYRDGRDGRDGKGVKCFMWRNRKWVAEE
jgi:hypothetical protein